MVEKTLQKRRLGEPPFSQSEIIVTALVINWGIIQTDFVAKFEFAPLSINPKTSQNYEKKT